MLEAGQPAPDFSSPNQDEKMIALADFRGKKNVILYFYPKDNTPGCTVEANQFTGLIDEFAELDTVILGVSRDSCGSHRAFIEKYALKMDLLADTSGDICTAYDVWRQRRKWYGAKKMGVLRSTFVIDKQGKLVHCEYSVNVIGHAKAMLALVEDLQNKATD